jgi:hypothetical protein
MRRNAFLIPVPSPRTKRPPNRPGLAIEFGAWRSGTPYVSASQNRRGREYDRSPERFNDAAFRHRFPRCRENVFALARASDCGLRCGDSTLDGMVMLVVASSSKRFVLEPGRVGETKTGRRRKSHCAFVRTGSPQREPAAERPGGAGLPPDEGLRAQRSVPLTDRPLSTAHEPSARRRRGSASARRGLASAPLLQVRSPPRRLERRWATPP